MYGPISLDRGEQLLCLFFRGEGQATDKIDPRDFERRLHLKPPEGGISFFRAKTTDYRQMIDWVKRLPLLNRGIATISVARVAELGFQICGNLEENEHHVCIHCVTCNCEENDCHPDAKLCSFISPENNIAENDRMRRHLADAMSIILEALKTRTELLEIFATDVDGTPAEKNVAYAHRWEVAVTKTSSGPSAR
jgi:hypothetical protein